MNRQTKDKVLTVLLNDQQRRKKMSEALDQLIELEERRIESIKKMMTRYTK